MDMLCFRLICSSVGALAGVLGRPLFEIPNAAFEVCQPISVWEAHRLTGLENTPLAAWWNPTGKTAQEGDLRNARLLLGCGEKGEEGRSWRRKGPDTLVLLSQGLLRAVRDGDVPALVRLLAVHRQVDEVHRQLIEEETAPQPFGHARFAILGLCLTLTGLLLYW